MDGPQPAAAHHEGQEEAQAPEAGAQALPFRRKAWPTAPPPRAAAVVCTPLFCAG